MQPGRYKNLDIRSYHDGLGLSSTGIKMLLDCPARYWNRYINPDRVDVAMSKDFVIGSATHCYVLEPEEYFKRYATIPKVDRRTKEGKAIFAEALVENKGKLILDEAEQETVEQCGKTLKNALRSLGIHEQSAVSYENSIYFRDFESEMLLKTRPDMFVEGPKNFVIDIKTTSSKNSSISGANPSAFERSIYNYGYYIQAALALDGLNDQLNAKFDTVYLVAVEKEAPYLCSIHMLSADYILFGRQKYKEAIDIYLRCLETGKWPSYTDNAINIADLPKWMKENNEG